MSAVLELGATARVGCPGVSMISTNRILMPYTNDLVRLAASVKIVIDSEHLTIRLKEGCGAILEGYQKTLKAGSCPFVLAEHEKNLERLGVEAFKPPDGFWEKLEHLPVVHHGLPRDVKKVLRKRFQIRIWITKR